MTPITYPARPINGGAFNAAVPKVGAWFVEPKDNGWRAAPVHVPTGTMFNRHGEQLSIAGEFQTALKVLRDSLPGIEWADCEALDRRHGRCRGTLIVLDAIVPCTVYTERRALLGHLPLHGITEDVRDAIRLIPSYPATEAERLYAELKAANATLGCEFYEGIVMKQANSSYPIQRLSPVRTTHTWVKHRWAW